MRRKISLFVLLAISLFYAIIIIPTWKENYIDFGDGNYIYISKRMASGQMLYRDILAPQPPIHLYTGKVIALTGEILGIDSPVVPFRLFSLILHILTIAAVFKTTKKLTAHDSPALIASVIYLIIPLGFWWTRGYQSEPLEVLFLLISFYYFIDFSRKSMIIAAVFSCLAALTNMTAVPFIFFNLLYLLIRKRNLILYYFLPFAAIMFIIILFFELKTGRYLENVFFNQVGSYPKKELYPAGVLDYAISKIAREGKDILFWEGMYIIFSLLGLVKYLKDSDRCCSEREYKALYTICSLGSFVYVTKGATMEYIFTIGEPWVAIFAGYYMWKFIQQNMKYTKSEIFNIKDISPITSIAVFLVIIFISVVIGLFNSYGTLQEKNDELNEEGVQQIKYFIETHSKPGDEILAPPFYAVVAKRVIYEDYAELFLWTIKYWNEVMVDKKPGLGVQKVNSIADALNNKKIPIAIIENDQTGRIPEIAKALKSNYEFAPPLKEPFKTLNTRLLIMIPKEN